MMEKLNKSRAISLSNAGFLYSALTVIFVGLSIFNKSEPCLSWSFIFFSITTVCMLLAYHIDNHGDTELNGVVRTVAFLVMIPYVIFGGVLLIIMNILINLCFRRRGEYHDE